MKFSPINEEAFNNKSNSKFTDDIFKVIDYKKSVLAVFIDFQKHLTLDIYKFIDQILYITSQGKAKQSSPSYANRWHVFTHIAYTTA